MAGIIFSPNLFFKAFMVSIPFISGIFQSSNNKSNGFSIFCSKAIITSVPELTDETLNERSNNLFSKITNQTTGYDSTYLGSLIESLRLCRCVVGNLESHLSHLALLLKKPFICIDNKMTLDAIGLLNPFKVPIIFADNIEEGLEKYETNIRFAKCRVG